MWWGVTLNEFHTKEKHVRAKRKMGEVDKEKPRQLERGKGRVKGRGFVDRGVFGPRRWVNCHLSGTDG